MAWIITTLQQHVDELRKALTTWDTRDHDRPAPGARSAANTAVDAIDAARRELYRLRTELTAEVHAYDAESMRRAEELLARIRGHRPCAHADLDGEGMHRLEPGESCNT